jgi:hypothetical protein
VSRKAEREGAGQRKGGQDLHFCVMWGVWFRFVGRAHAVGRDLSSFCRILSVSLNFQDPG